MLRSSAKCSGVEGVLGPDFVNVVLEVVIKSYQHAIVLAPYCNECVAFVCCYQVVAIGRRIYNGSAVRMVSHLLELPIPFTLNSEGRMLVRSPALQNIQMSAWLFSV